jgi:hypothetical protein
MKGLCPVGGRERRLKKKAADHVGGGANHALDPAVLSRGVGTRETQLDAVSEEERTGGVVVTQEIVLHCRVRCLQSRV